jgi:hypothetical protein
VHAGTDQGKDVCVKYKGMYVNERINSEISYIFFVGVRGDLQCKV